MITATDLNGPAFNIRSQTSQHHHTPQDTGSLHTQSISNPATSDLTTVETTQDITLKPLTADRYEALPQM